MQRNLFFVFLSIFGNQVYSQLPQVSGFIRDDISGEAIQGAIATDSSSFQYTYSNKDGYYNLGVSSGKHTLVFTAAGYQKQRYILDVYNSQELVVQLKKLPLTEADTHSNLHSSINDYRSGYTAPLASQVQNMPALLSVKDPVKFLQYLPGVSGGIEGLAGMYVRGGNADQNLVTMDGLPVYGNGHIFGLLSNFNPDQVRDVQFYRGVMPARYGGRAGSVMDVSTPDGNQYFGQGSFTSDLVNLNINYNGPLNASGTTTASFGMRRSWLDLLFKRPTNGNYLYYNLHDFNGKVVFRPNKKDKIAVWVYNGRDKFGVQFITNEFDSLNVHHEGKETQSIVWQNTLTGVNFSHRISDRHYSQFLVGMARYTYNSPYYADGTITTDTTIDTYILNYKQQIHLTDFIGKANFEYNYNANNSLRYGGELISHNFKPNTISVQYEANNISRLDTIFGKANVQNASEGSVYAEWESNLSAGLKLNAGARLWTFFGKEKTYIRPEPRIFISQLLKDKKALKLGFSIANQGIHQLGSVNGNLPSDVWFPTSKNFKPQQNIQATAGFYEPWRKGIEFSLDLYYKWMNGITDKLYSDDNLPTYNYWESIITQGKGNAYGLEVLMMKKTGSFNGLFSYSYSKSTRTFADLNFGNTFPFRWDRRHKAVIQGVLIASKYVTINFALVFMTGNAVSVPTGKYVTADGSFIYDYSEKNNYRMPMYKRLDLGFTKILRASSFEKSCWGVNVYNVLNFKNPLFVNLQEDSKGKVRAYGLSFFPFVPSVFYRYEF
ncbi:MAG: TonB-dependent receptor [Bacteroidetes bacterium]|nr:TonB-dependent receptor [Bacteroidota bacterium]